MTGDVKKKNLVSRGGSGGCTTRRYYQIAPSSVTFGDSFPPRGSLRSFGTLG